RTGQRVGRVLEAAVDIWGERRRRISTGELNRMVAAASERQLPPIVKGRRPKIFYAAPAAGAPPTLFFFANDAASVHFSYRRYLENRLRDTFGFAGTPLRLVFRDRRRVELERHHKPRTAKGKAAARAKGVKGTSKGPARTAKGATRTAR